ncbi:MAG: amino acid ABC transporter permease [Halanaerobiaceae bacterium]|nr:amino acid ABC transporter permease [Halanaerobiaceae bacterium]
MGDLVTIFLNSYPILFRGLMVTLLLTIASSIFGTIFGIFLSLGKIYGNKLVSRITTLFIALIQGTPLLVQLFVVYYGLPVYGINLSPVWAALISFIINSGAYQAEYLRGSIQSVSSGQLKAGLSIGMSKWQSIFFIILPQALRRVIPAWTNEFIYLLKYTSLAYIITAPELMGEAKIIASRNYEFFKTYLVVAFIYLIVVIIFTQIFNYLEKKFAIPGFEFER